MAVCIGPPLGVALRRARETYETVALPLSYVGARAAVLLSAILVANMLNGVFTQQIPQIGIMKAIGARSGDSDAAIVNSTYVASYPAIVVCTGFGRGRLGYFAQRRCQRLDRGSDLRVPLDLRARIRVGVVDDGEEEPGASRRPGLFQTGAKLEALRTLWTFRSESQGGACNLQAISRIGRAW